MAELIRGQRVILSKVRDTTHGFGLGSTTLWNAFRSNSIAACALSAPSPSTWSILLPFRLGPEIKLSSNCRLSLSASRSGSTVLATRRVSAGLGRGTILLFDCADFRRSRA